MQIGCDNVLVYFLQFVSIQKSLYMKFALSLSERIRSRFGSNFFISLKVLVALFVLFLPAVFAVICANRFADSLYGPMADVLAPALLL